jgi:hypothetical protein
MIAVVAVLVIAAALLSKRSAMTQERAAGMMQ